MDLISIKGLRLGWKPFGMLKAVNLQPHPRAHSGVQFQTKLKGVYKMLVKNCIKNGFYHAF